jgi:hypothetical protein
MIRFTRQAQAVAHNRLNTADGKTLRSRTLLALTTVVTLVACANENGAIPFDRETWSLETDSRGKPFPANGG